MDSFYKRKINKHHTHTKTILKKRIDKFKIQDYRSPFNLSSDIRKHRKKSNTQETGDFPSIFLSHLSLQVLQGVLFGKVEKINTRQKFWIRCDLNRKIN